VLSQNAGSQRNREAKKTEAHKVRGKLDSPVSCATESASAASAIVPLMVLAAGPACR